MLVLADRIGASGLSHGKDRRIRSIGIPIPDNASKSENRLAHEKMIQTELESSKIELVVLSGYMRILSPWIVGKWKGKIG